MQGHARSSIASQFTLSVFHQLIKETVRSEMIQIKSILQDEVRVRVATKVNGNRRNNNKIVKLRRNYAHFMKIMRISIPHMKYLYGTFPARTVH